MIAKPELFKRGMNVEDWIQEFISYLNVNAISSNRKEILIMHIDKDCRALMRAHHYNNDDNHAFQEAISLMRKLFSKPLPTPLENKKLLLQRTQNRGENGYCFYQELRKIARKAYPDALEPELESIIKEQFINGISNASTRMKLRFDSQKTMQQLLDIVELQETILAEEEEANRSHALVQQHQTIPPQQFYGRQNT